MQRNDRQPEADFGPSMEEALAHATAIQSTQPVRRLVRMKGGDDSRPVNSASLPRVDLANDGAIVRLLSGEPERNWMMPIFDRRR